MITPTSASSKSWLVAWNRIHNAAWLIVAEQVNDVGNVIERVLPTMYNVNWDRWQHDFVANGREECVRFLLRENTIQNASAVVFKRDLYDIVGGVIESLSPGF